MNVPATAEAYPLQWPDGWPRSGRYRGARYQVEFGKALRDLVDELRKFRATHIVISSNVPTRANGLPYANAGSKRYDDPGIAVYFTVQGHQRVIACDHWDHVKDNLRACGLTVAAMRMIERAGATEIISRAFNGFKALPPPPPPKPPWWQVFGVDPKNTSLADVNAIYKSRARKAHPDAGGSEDEITALNQARDDAHTALTEMRPETLPAWAP